MNYFSALKYTSLAVMLCVLAGCKIAVIVAEGGTVESTSSGTCLEGTVCLHEVSDTNYSESFTAVADDGWKFKKWNRGGGFFCADSTDPICNLSNTAGEGNALIEGLVNSDRTYYIMPIFTACPAGGCLITDTVAAVGRTWAQVDLFYGLSWDDINAVCPTGVCVNGGLLNGYDMTGWQWADVSAVNELFNSYGVTPPLVGPSDAEQVGTSWGTAFYNDGWNAYVVRDYEYTWGWVADSKNELEGYQPYIEYYPLAVDATESAYSDYSGTKSSLSESLGAWFYLGEVDEK